VGDARFGAVLHVSVAFVTQRCAAVEPEFSDANGNRISLPRL
jgi:hypothetical protein